MVTLHNVVCWEGVTYENSRTPGRSVVGEIYHTGLLLLKGRGRLRNSGLDLYFWISLKRMPLLLKHIGLPSKSFKLLTKVSIGFQYSEFSLSPALLIKLPHVGPPFWSLFLEVPPHLPYLWSGIVQNSLVGMFIGWGRITRTGHVTRCRDAVLLLSPPLTNIHPEEGWSWSSTLAIKVWSSSSIW